MGHTGLIERLRGWQGGAAAALGQPNGGIPARGFRTTAVGGPAKGVFADCVFWNHMPSLEGEGQPGQRADVRLMSVGRVFRLLHVAWLKRRESPHSLDRVRAGFSLLPPPSPPSIKEERELLSASSVRFSNIEGAQGSGRPRLLPMVLN